jgi:hypothetical protein
MSSDEADRTLKDVFAEPFGEEAADPLFVARVMGQIARRRRVHAAIGAGIAALFVVGLLFAAPLVTTSANVVGALPLLITGPVQTFLASPASLVASLPIGILALTLSTLRLTNLNA